MRLLIISCLLLASALAQTVETTFTLPTFACTDSGAVVVKYPDTNDGPWPLVAFAHGAGEGAAYYDAYTTAMAAAGFTVLALDGCQAALPYNEIEADQIAAVTYALSDWDMAGTVTSTDFKVGLAGHSMGGYATVQNSGLATLTITTSTATVDVEIGAILANSPAAQMPNGYGSPTTDIPCLFTVGSNDMPQLSEGAAQSVHGWLDSMTGPRLFVEGNGLEHMDVDNYSPLVGDFLGCFLKPATDNGANCDMVFSDAWCTTSTADLTISQCTQEAASFTWDSATTSAPAAESTASTTADSAATTTATATTTASDSSGSYISVFFVFMLIALRG